jgi:succinate dehydrogenase/fumarate reductase cytochrome b subunit
VIGLTVMWASAVVGAASGVWLILSVWWVVADPRAPRGARSLAAVVCLIGAVLIGLGAWLGVAAVRGMS